jgi:enamine deaminase RidA (YjgF/YER057c/UK114 family)
MPQQTATREVVNPWSWQDQFGFVHANVVAEGHRVAYCAGQTSVDADGNPVHEGNMAAQIELALANLVTVLGESGMDLSDVVRLNYYVTDVDAFFAAGETLATLLAKAGCRPASTLLGVVRLAFPEFLIELEATAVT